jgi:hypothetical protein
MIGRVVAAWVAVGACLVALPALAWWTGRRPRWDRLTPHREPDVYRELVRRHALRPAEAAEVENAVTWGRELQDPRLRAAVVDWVRSTRPVAEPVGRRRPRWQLALAWLVVLGIPAGLCALAFRLGGWYGLLFTVVVLGGGQVLDWAIGRGPQRALQRNEGPARS